MTKLPSLVLAATLATPLYAEGPAKTPAPARAPTANSLYQQGIAAEKAGDPTAAIKAYQAALKENPRHANARYKLGYVKSNKKSIAAKGYKAKFDAVVIPEIKLAGASFQESIEVLQLLIEKQSKGNVNPGFIIKDPEKKLDEAKISLVLKNMPAKAVMKYILEQGRAKARYDQYAIIITPIR